MSPNTKFNNLILHSKIAAEISVTKEIIKFFRHIFHEPIVAVQSLTMWKGTQQPIHVDYPYVNTHTKISHQVASWIALEDIHTDAGPLMYWPGSHDINKVPPFEWNEAGNLMMDKSATRTPSEMCTYLESKIEKAGINGKIFLPKKGDALLWHGHLSHAGTAVKNLELSRKSHVTHYSSLSGFPTWKKKNQSLRFGNEEGCVFHAPWIEEDEMILDNKLHSNKIKQ